MTLRLAPILLSVTLQLWNGKLREVREYCFLITRQVPTRSVLANANGCGTYSVLRTNTVASSASFRGSQATARSQPRARQRFEPHFLTLARTSILLLGQVNILYVRSYWEMRSLELDEYSAL
jgi:hypothetical protein